MKQASGAEIGFISWIYLIDLYALAEAMPLFIPPKIPP
jgi:hypothetical protein